MECNCFIESLDLLLDESKVYSTMMENTYYIQEDEKAIEIVIKIDLKKIFKFIFDKFIQLLKTIWNRFRAAYNSYMQKSILLKRYKKKLENIDWQVNYSESRPNFTNLDNSTNINMYKMILDQQYSTFIQDLEKISNCRDIGTIHTTILNIKNNMIPLDQYLDQQRGQALGTYSGISKEEFAEAVTSYFKPDTVIPPGTIQPTEIKRITNEYFSSKNMEKIITREQASLEIAANNTSNKIGNVNLARYIPNKDINPEIASAFSEIIRGYCNRVQGVCNIYIQLFAIKLDIFKLYKEEQVKFLSKVVLQSMKEGKM